jgi:hypothetical protein
LDWFQRDTDDAQAYIGVFDVAVSGNRIDRYFGCYWWD